MFDYYHYFVDKGNHPDKQTILNQEKNIDIKKLRLKIDMMKNEAINYASKPIGMRIMVHHEVLLDYLDASLTNESLEWLRRKEKDINETGYSSYYIFLENMDSHQYDYMIDDQSYAICGGGFPIYDDQQLVGSITVTGCRPDEDHEIIIYILKKTGLL